MDGGVGGGVEFELGAELAVALGTELEPGAEDDAVVEGSGAPLPAVSEPRPSLFSESASIFPVGGNPFLS